MLFIYFMYDVNFSNTAYTNEKTNPPTGVLFQGLVFVLAAEILCGAY